MVQKNKMFRKKQMIANILLIENNQNTLKLVETFFNKLGLENYTISLDYTHALKIIDSMNLDIIICNPSVIENENFISFLKRKRELAIPVLWLIQENDTSLTKISLSYTLSSNALVNEHFDY